MFRFARLMLIACFAALVLTQAALATAPQPASKAAVIRAETARGDALNRLYGLGRYTTPTPAQLRAIQRRSIAMNKVYGLGQFARPAAPGFDWGDAGIGGAAVLGTVLLAAAGAAVAVRRRQSPVDAV
jgi:hypothetical protein